MIIAVDIGNTNISLGILKDDEVVSTFRLNTKNTRTSDEYGMIIYTFLNSVNIKKEDIDDVIISSVVPNIMHSFINSIKKYLDIDPFIVGAGIKTGIKVNSENPKEVGADRIVDVAYAYHTYHRACIIIDFGTATTFDYVDKFGVFKYTVIAPGIKISANALTRETAKLPDIEIKKPESILGNNTITGMQSGVVYGYIGLVEYIIKKMKEELNDDSIYVIATGGLGRIIANETKLIDIYEPNVAYKGLKIIYDRNK